MPRLGRLAPPILWCAAALLPVEGRAASERPVDGSDWAGQAFASEVPVPRAGGAVTTGDLLALRDLGAMSLSPDGRWIAFSVRQAAPQVDDYAIRWFVVPSDGSSPPIPLPVDGGRPIRGRSAGLLDGAIARDPAKWSPDGARLAFRRRVGDRVELWAMAPATGVAERVADGTAQVAAFGWTPRGTLVFRTGLDMARFARSVEAEAGHGWLLNQRMTLFAARTPSPLPPDCRTPHPACDLRTLAVAPNGLLRSATPTEAAALDAGAQGAAASKAAGGGRGVVSGVGEGGALAWTQAADPAKAGNARPLRQVVTDASGAGACAAPVCIGQDIRAIGWARDGASIWFLRRMSSRDDEARGPLDQFALVEWPLGAAPPRVAHRGYDLLEDCQAHGRWIYCVESSATRPMRIVAIDLDGGGLRVLADPNPTLRTKSFPRIRHVILKDPEGNFGFARLVYPNDYRAGRAYPLVVVQYRSQGFLRGGTPGDEYPILPLAAEGFFVLSVDMPDDLRAWRNLDQMAVTRARRADQWALKSLVGAIEAAIDPLIAEGLVDPRRVAITGLSWGAQSVHYALQRSDRFAAAIASQAAADITYYAQFPDGAEKRARMAGTGDRSVLAGPGSPILQSAWSPRPERLRTPLLLNLGQDEALFGFEGLAVLREADRPLEVRVFPGEGHTKYHPRNLAGVYENNLMWLTFWLQGREDPRPEFAEQYGRWRAMRSRLQAEARGDAPRVSGGQDGERTGLGAIGLGLTNPELGGEAGVDRHEVLAGGEAERR